MKSFHYGVFGALLAVGLGASVLLVPHQDELGMILFKARQYPEARRVLEKRLAVGDHSIDVLVPLAEILVQSGDVEQALALLRNLPVPPAERIELVNRIGRFERYGQLTWDYLHTLQEINRRKGSEETLRELVDLYRYLNLTKPLAAALSELIADYRAEPADFVELANLEAIEGRTSHAGHVLEELGRRHPEAMNSDAVEFLISVLLDAGDTARAREQSARWLALHNLPAEALRLAGLMESRGKPELGLQLLKPFETATDTNPALLVELVHLQVATGASEAAFERLRKLYRARLLPNELGAPLLELALARHDLDLAISLAGEKGLERFPNWLLANLAEAAMAEKRDDFVHHMIAGVKEDFLAARPLLAVRLALARGDHGGAIVWLQRVASDSQLRDADRLTVAADYFDLGRRHEAFEQLSNVQLENLAEAELIEAARIYTNLDKAREGIRRFDALRLRGARPGGAAGWALLAAGAGRGHEALALLPSLPEAALSEDLLKDLYYAAADHNEPDLATECARRLYINRGDYENRLRLAMALNLAGRPLEALPHLRALLVRPAREAAERSSTEEAFTAALRNAAQRSEPARAAELFSELRTFWTAQLKRAGLDEKQRLNIIYGLLEIHAWDEALPLLAELAHRHLELAPLYIESAVEAGRKQDVASFLKSDLARDDLEPADRETRVYALIEHGGYDTALGYISRLAQSSGGQWVAAYEDALTKLGRIEELAAFWRNQARRSGASPDEKRVLAFKLLNAARRDLALEIFLDLAGNAKPDQQDVSDLLFLWGPKPGPEALTWLERRARSSTGEERAAWWKHMLGLGGAERVALMAEDALPKAGLGGSLVDTYLEALAQIGGKRLFGATLTREVAAVNDPERVRRLARLARESGVSAAAETAYSRLLTLAAGDQEALHWLGMYAFSRATYSAAEHYLQPLLDAAEGSYEDAYYYGELLWRKGDRRTARVYYGRALRLIDALPAPAPEARALYAHSLARCGFLEKALAEFRSLVAVRFDNPELRADFVALLLENSRYAEARDILSADAGSNGRLIELRAQLLAATARRPEALHLMQEFTRAYPDRAQALAALAALDVSAGRQRQARGLLERAASLEPGNEDVARAIEDLDREQSARIQMEAMLRSIQGAQSEDLMHVAGEQMMGAFRLRVGVDQDVASVRSVRSPDGTIAPFHGVLRGGEASVSYALGDGTRLQGTAFGSDAGPGAGATVVRPDAGGLSELHIEFGRPYWEFAESLAGGGTRDRVEVRRQTALGRRNSARLGAALNRYSLEHVRDAASSVAGQAALTLNLAARPNVFLEYNVDGEYKLSAVKRVDPGGIQFHPLPLISREVHSGSVGAAGKITRSTEANAAAGFAIDRFGGHAPFVTLNLKYGGRGPFGAELDFDRRLYFLDTARTVNTLGGRLTFRF